MIVYRFNVLCGICVLTGLAIQDQRGCDRTLEFKWKLQGGAKRKVYGEYEFGTPNGKGLGLCPNNGVWA